MVWWFWLFFIPWALWALDKLIERIRGVEAQPAYEIQPRIVARDPDEIQEKLDKIARASRN
jgi:hypothetical protein